jgi:hypothetical protein
MPIEKQVFAWLHRENIYTGKLGPALSLKVMIKQSDYRPGQTHWVSEG